MFQAGRSRPAQGQVFTPGLELIKFHLGGAFGGEARSIIFHRMMVAASSASSFKPSGFKCPSQVNEK